MTRRKIRRQRPRLRLDVRAVLITVIGAVTGAGGLALLGLRTSPILSFATVIALGCYALASGFVLVKLVSGPRARDRVLALDRLYFHGMLVIVVLGIGHGSDTVRPRVRGEFQDSASLMVFGRAGEGVCAAPTVLVEEIMAQHRLALVAEVEGVHERFYAVTAERKLHTPRRACDHEQCADQALSELNRWRRSRPTLPLTREEEDMRVLAHDTVLTEFDRRRLRGLLAVLRKRSTVDASNLDALELELERAQVVPPERLPANVVSMNSRVCLLDVDRAEQTTLSLVFPNSRNDDRAAVPVLSPLGLALLGCREGDELVWPTHGGTRRLRIERVVYQPEAAGDYFS